MKSFFFNLAGLGGSIPEFPRLVRRSSFRFAFWYCLKGRRLARDFGDGGVRRLTTKWQKRVSVPVLERAPPEGYTVVWFVRDPAQRVASAYLEKFAGFDLKKPFVEEVVRQAGTKGSISFAQFLEYLATQDNDRVDKHWRRQSWNAAGFADPHIVRQEHLFEDIRAIGLPLLSDNLDLLPWRNARAAGAERAVAAAAALAADLTDVPNTRIKQMMENDGVKIRADVLLTPAARARIAEIYREDYARLPYRPDFDPGSDSGFDPDPGTGHD